MDNLLQLYLRIKASNDAYERESGRKLPPNSFYKSLELSLLRKLEQAR